MRGLVVALTACTLISVHGADFSPELSYSSPKAFVERASAFHPSRASGYMANLFTLLAASGEAAGAPSVPEAITSATIVWQGKHQAVAFVVAKAEVDGTLGEVGVMFLLSQSKGEWRICALRRFEATGKNAQIDCDLTSAAGSGYSLGEERLDAVLTVRRTDGGRGYSYSASRSYRIGRGPEDLLRLEEFF